MPRPTRNTKRKDYLKIERQWKKTLAKTKGQPDAKRRKKLGLALSK